MFKKLQNLLFEDDEFVEDNNEAELVGSSKPVQPLSQQPATEVQQTAEMPVTAPSAADIPPVPVAPVVPEVPKQSAVFLDNEPKKSTMINLDDEDDVKPSEKKQAIKPTKQEVKYEERRPSKEYRFNPVISPIFGIDEKDMNAVKTTTSKLTEKEKAKFEKNVSPILSPMYGISIEKNNKPTVKSEEAIFTSKPVLESEPADTPHPVIEDEIPEFSLDDILNSREEDTLAEEDDDLFGSTATSEFDFGTDDQLFPNLSFDDLERETADDSTMIIARPRLDLDDDHSNRK